MRLLFTAALSTIVISVLAQTTQDYSLLLRSGGEPVEPNTTVVSSGEYFTPADYVDGSAYVIVQFWNLPSVEDRERMSVLGLELRDYLPNYAYFARLSEEFDLNRLQTFNFNIRAVIRIQPHHKINPVLYSEPLPDYALDTAGRIKVIVQLFEGARYRASDQLVLDAPGSTLTMSLERGELETIAAHPEVQNIELVSPPPIPDDTEGRSLHRSNMLDASYATGRHYDGTGVSGAVGDDGEIGPHIDYQGRLDQSNATTPDGSHGDMVSGIMMGAANLNPRIKGMASGLFLYYYDIDNYEHVVDAPNLHNNFGVMVTSTSYSQGCNAGYTTDTRNGDQMIRQNPSLIHVFSAGNSAASNCGYGAGAGWGNITGGYKQGKNVIATANLDNMDVRTSSSSRGPAADGRLKPDIAANGTGQLSTNGPNTYQVGGGTSAASPGIAGIIAQLYQAYRELNSGNNPESSLIKGTMLNTAEDLGNPGPDYSFGWGRVNALRAVQTLEQNKYLSGTINNGGNNSHNIVVPAGTRQLRVMCYWLDWEGSTIAAKALVNDLDFTVTDPSSAVFQPWVLDPTPNPGNLNADAVRGVDTLNNMEQVTIADPTAGTYQVNIAGTTVPQGPQKYWIIYWFDTDEITLTYPNGGEGFVPGESEILRWDAFADTGTFHIEYSLDNGSNWNTIAAAQPGSDRQLTWTVPSGLTGEAQVRISRGAESDVSDANFSVIDVPDNLTIQAICPTYTRIAWDAVSGATGYEVYQLGAMYMDSIGFTTNTFFEANVGNTSTEWFSVRAYGPTDAKGRRAIAIERPPGTNCPSPNDAALVEILNPSGVLPTCLDLSNVPVTVVIGNSATNALSNIPVSYQLDAGTPVNETYTGTLQPFELDTFTFGTTVNLASTGTYNLSASVDLLGDTDASNDQQNTSVGVQNGTTIAAFPYNEDFETFTACGTQNNCGATNCVLANGWFNYPNGTRDAIDWRTDAGGTPSNNTGPFVDLNPGTAQGNYLFTEASACFEELASMNSPCFDFTSITGPLVAFGYHMRGTSHGSLHLDVLANGSWTYDVWEISGPQGSDWHIDTVDLSNFAGTIATLRFRGFTGTAYDSDIAIDDIRVFDAHAEPIADFTSTQTTQCAGMAVQLSDNSQNTVTSWDWQFTPGTVTFISGTNANSQNPVVQFNDTGHYDVQLIASNAFGSDTSFQAQYILITNGFTLPYYEDFETQSACGDAADCEQEICTLVDGWTNAVNGVEDDIDWRVDANGTVSAGTGPSVDHNPGTASGYYLYLEASNGCEGQRAELISPCIDLSSVSAPKLSYWYHMFGTSMGDLHVDLLSGNTWNLDITAPKSGDLGDQWLVDTIDLTPYVGSTVRIRWRGITGTGFASDLAIDDIGIFESGAPAAAFTNSTPVCVNEAVTFTDNSLGVIQTYDWDFGTDATPPTANTQGPHSVMYSTPGPKTISLTVTNALGSSSSNVQITVVAPPVANFSAADNGFDATFTNSSSGAVNSSWDFGDGNTSSDANPTHTYADTGTYTVQLIASNGCGSDTIEQTITILGTGIGFIEGVEFEIVPNPNEGVFRIQANTDAALVEVFDTRGRLVLSSQFSGSTDWVVRLREPATAVYFVKLSSRIGVGLQKIVVE